MSATQAETLLRRLREAPAVLVTVDAAQGSVPRDAGAWMAVWADATLGTVGGGRLEFDAIAQARTMLMGTPAQGADATGGSVLMRRFPLGPSLGQCCGGVVHLRFERVDAADTDCLRGRLLGAMAPVALFGGGHVGRALVQILGALPFQVRWIDSRDEIFPDAVPANVVCEHSDPVQAAVRQLPTSARVLIMSFSHAEDLDVVAACLQRQRERADLAYIGLIGSKSKWASFRQRLMQRGFDDSELAQITCPVGVPGIAGKEPEVIAVAVAAQLLQIASPRITSPVLLADSQAKD
ncbi:MAG: xanthine dehydrogenase accessory protein XdhC [Burkholderiaceae bacterium]|nr:xanthine dehydrogenase accessory protein XdhC [Burkholderiaceae bacterium]MDP1968528.1 xanthine dehydrogenase accessory protein XdhC [Burkholderiaceae bacterium]